MREDVVAAWAGIRPLIPSARETPGAVSREHVVTASASGLVSISGGKLTTYRVMAVDTLRVACKTLGRPLPPEVREPLPGGNVESFDALVAAIEREGGDGALATHLAGAHGSRWSDVWTQIADGGGERVVDGQPYTIGELRYCVRAESACTLGDLLIRRTKLAFQRRDHGISVADRVAREVAGVMGWSEPDTQNAVTAYTAEVSRIFSIDP
jgi:glycerol-3-phosphate dehydrogenase